MQKRYSVLIIIACWSICLFCIGCIEPEKPYYPLDPGLKKYFDYKKGTYWVYKDAHNGTIDTIEVTGSSLDESSGYDQYNIGMQQKSNSYSRSLLIRPNVTTWSIFRYEPIASVHFNLTSMYPFVVGETAINKPWGTHKTEYHSSYSAGAIVYKDVYEVSVIDTYWAINDTLYFNYDNGFIRLKEHNPLQDHDWVLQKENVIR